MEEPLVLSIYMKDPSKIRGVGDKMYPWDLVSLELRRTRNSQTESHEIEFISFRILQFNF